MVCFKGAFIPYKNSDTDGKLLLKEVTRWEVVEL